MIQTHEVKNLIDSILDSLTKMDREVTDEIIFAFALQSLGEPSLPGDLEEYPKVVKELLRRTGFLKWGSD